MSSEKQNAPGPGPALATDDDDDLDDLDDVLDDFAEVRGGRLVKEASSGKSAKGKDVTTEGTRVTTTGKPALNQVRDGHLAPRAAVEDDPASSAAGALEDDAAFGLDDEMLGEEFTRHLAEGMEQLMKGLEGGDDEGFRRQFEKLMAADLGGLDEKDTTGTGTGVGGGTRTAGAGVNPKAKSEVKSKPASSSSSGAASKKKANAAASVASSGPAKGQDFQDTVRQTMERMRDSSQQVDASVAESGGDPLTQLLGMLSDTNNPDLESGDMNSVLEGMMEQLMSKEVLYQPMKELDEKFPAWLREETRKIASGESEMAEDELRRYREQSRYVKLIVAKFESPKWDDNDPQKSKEMLELMNKMQEYGSPPTDILGEMAPGLEMGQDGLPNLGENCNPQ